MRLWHLLTTLWLTRKLRRSQTATDKHAAQRALTEHLAKGRGLPMKVGQVVAGMNDDNAWQQLTQSVKPWPLKDMLPILEKAWQHKPSDILRSIDESQAAASLGQVHHAILHSGDEVAIKIQYPDIAKAIQAELMLAGIIPRGGPVKRWGFNLDAYKNTLKDNMLKELDYLQEMQMQQQYAQQMHVQGLAVPKVFSGLCHERVLVQAWVKGERIAKVAKTWSRFERLSVGKTLMQTMFQSLFKHGLVHGDPHPGNVLIQKHEQQPVVHLLDYGCMIQVPKQARYALLQLILASQGKMHIDPLEGFVAMGFDALKLKSIEPKLPALMQIIFRPFLQQRSFHVQDWHPALETENLLGQQKWLFRAAGPAQLFLLMRVFQGLALQLQTLNVALPWWPVLEQTLDKTWIQGIQNKQLVKQVHIPDFKGSATALHVCIQQTNKPDIHFELPAASALELSSLIPSSAHDVIQRQHIDIQRIEQRLREQGLEPGTLLDIQDGDKRYRIDLR